MPYVTVNGIKTHYQQTGSGPDVILVHAFTSNLAAWIFCNLMESLSGDFRVTAYDMRGHGNSDTPSTGYTTEILANDLHTLQQELEIPTAYLVGHSLGGVVATHAAALYPDSVNGVILSDSFFPGLSELEPNLGDAPVWRELRHTLLRVGVDIGEEVDFQNLFECVREFTEEQKADARRLLGPTGARWLEQLAHLGATTAARDVFLPSGLTADTLRSIDRPVVALYDEHSPFVATRQFLVDQLPNCISDTVPGTEHVALLQNGAAFSGMVLKYLCEMAHITDPRFVYCRCPDCGQANLLRQGLRVCNVCGRDLEEACQTPGAHSG